MDKLARRRWHNMLVAAMTDRKLDPEEKTYLEEMRRELGISQEEARSIVADYKAKRGNIELSGTREQRVRMLHDLVRVFLADGELGPRERKCMFTVARHLKLSPDETDAMLATCQGEARASSERKSRVSTDAPERTRVPAVAARPPAAAAPHAAAPASPPPPEIAGNLHEKTGIELIGVPASTFIFGDMSVGGRKEEQPVKAFAIGKYPVTNAQWRRFEQEVSYQGRKDFGPRFNGPTQPVVGVNIEDARAFCRWAGLRLPTEMEWERAARGTDGRKYPWGDHYPVSKYANFGSSMFDASQPRTTEVGSFPHGMSPVGCLDMVGNVEEWCDNGAPDRRDRYPVRGANWLSATYALNVYYHFLRPRDLRTNALGFRVACDG